MLFVWGGVGQQGLGYVRARSEFIPVDPSCERMPVNTCAHLRAQIRRRERFQWAPERMSLRCTHEAPAEGGRVVFVLGSSQLRPWAMEGGRRGFEGNVSRWGVLVALQCAALKALRGVIVQETGNSNLLWVFERRPKSGHLRRNWRAVQLRFCARWPASFLTQSASAAVTRDLEPD